MPKKTSTVETRFWQKVQKSDGCWLWLGSPSSVYGYLAITPTQNALAHRFMWELSHGPIPPGLFVCHHCDVPKCVRPEHLFVGTPKANSQDMVRKGRAYSGERHHLQPGSPGPKYDRATLAPRGQSHGMAVLTEDVVRAMRSDRASGMTYREISKRYGLHPRHAVKVVTGELWRHVK